MPVITLTTDWGLEGPYIGILKAQLYARIHALNFVDLSHNIGHEDIVHCYYVLSNAYPYFPKGSVHFIGLNPLEKNETYLAVKFKEHYFVGADNGIFTLLAGDESFEAIQITTLPTHSNFDILNILCDILSSLYNGNSLESIGIITNKFVVKGLPRASISSDILKGHVIHVDQNGNGITNIDKELFERSKKDRAFEIMLPLRKNDRIHKITQHLSHAHDGEAIAMFNYNNMLQILIKDGSAADLCRLFANQQIIITFS